MKYGTYYAIRKHEMSRVFILVSTMALLLRREPRNSPRLVIYQVAQRNQTIPTSNAPPRIRISRELEVKKKNSPSRLSRHLPCPCLFPTHLAHARQQKNTLPSGSPLLSSPFGCHQEQGAPLNICILSRINHPPPARRREGSQPSTANQPLGVQPWRLLALDTAASSASKTRGSGLDVQSVHDMAARG